MDFTCGACGTAFAADSKPGRRNRFCSQQCSAISRRNRAVKNCLWCGHDFEVKASTSGWRRLCSQRCRALWLSDLSWTRSVIRTESCWHWVGAMQTNGYGRFGRRSANNEKLAHRVAYTKANGPIPAGLTIDHLCRNKKCVNPAHLEAVSMKENRRRADEARRAEKERAA